MVPRFCRIGAGWLFCVAASCSTEELPPSGGGGGGPAVPPPSWSLAWGGDDEEIANSVAFAPDGHVVVGGFWWKGNEPFDFGCGDLGPSYVDAYDMFLARLDADGTCVWSRSFGGAPNAEGASDTLHDLVADLNGDVIFTGSLNGDIDFAPEASGGELDKQGIASAHVVKLDGASGAHLWSTVFYGGTATVTGNGIAADAEGHVLVTGRLHDAAYFGPFILSSDDIGDVFVTKLDRDSGQAIWATALGYANADQGNAIAVDPAGNVIVAGMADEYSFPAADMFAAKLDGATGQPIWERLLSAGEEDVARISRVATTPAGDVVVVGEFRGTLELGQTTLISADTDGFVALLNQAQGAVRWAVQLGGPGRDGLHGLAVDDAGVLFVAGARTANSENVLVAALNDRGTVLWERLYGGAQSQSALALALGPAGQVAVVGGFHGQLQIVPGEVLRCEISPGVDCDPLQHYANVFGAVFVP